MSKTQPLESIEESSGDKYQPMSSPEKPVRSEAMPRTRPYQDVNSSPLRNSPAVRSPIKPVGTSPLPPVRLNSLNITKRRRLELEPSSPIDATHVLTSSVRRNSEGHITPQKARSFSTPVRFMGRRTPSLQDKPIPILSPPSPEASLESAVVKSSSPLQNSASSNRLLNSASSSSPSDEKSTPLNVSRRRVTAPIFSSPPRRVEGDAELDRQIQNWKCLVSVAKGAYEYEDSEDEENSLEEIIEQHRKAAQRAAAYLLEEGQNRSEEVGIDEFTRHLSEQRDRFNEPFDDFNTSRLSRLQLKEYEELKRCYAARRSSATSAAETASSQLDMRRLLGILDVDYDLLFPN